MSIKMRSLLIMAAVLMISALAWSAVAAQEATATVEPPAAATTEPTEAAVPEATTEAGMADMGSMDHAGRPFLGVSLQESADGVTIAEVVDGSAAAAAGLQVGDMITAINGTSVATVADAANAIGSMSIGDEVTIDVTRDGSTVTVTATLGEQAKDQNQPMNPPRGQGRGDRDQMFGFQYNSDDQSWTISNLPEDSALYTAGLRSGDVITSVDDSSYDPAGLFQYIASLGADAMVTLSVERDGATQDITVNASDLMMMGGMGMGDLFGRGDGNGIPFDFSQMMPFMQSAYGNGYLGVGFMTLDATVAQENNLTVTDGALISEVAAGSPAETAGLQANDVVTEVNGEAVDAEHTLRDRLIAYEPDDSVTLTVLRDGASQEIQVTLGQPQMPEMGQMFGGQGRGGFPFGNRGGQNQPEATPEAVPNA